MSDQTVEHKSERAVIVLVGGCNHLSVSEIQAMLQKQLSEDGNPIPDNITFVERPEFPEFPELMLESIEDMERREAKFFKNMSYQQQQKDLRFLNKRKKR